MITKNDCLILLADLKKQGVNTSKEVISLLDGNLMPSLKLINSKRLMDIS